jgi:tetratricopeptide (TPR) repeat protein
MSKARVTTCLLVLLLAAAQTVAARQADAPTLYRLSLPERDWALDVTIPRPAVAPGGAALAADIPRLAAVPSEYLSETGRTYILTFWPDISQKNRKKFAFLEVTLMPAQAPGGAKECRAYLLKQLSKSGGTVTGLKTWEYKLFAVSRYKFGFDLLGGGSFIFPKSIEVNPADLRTAEAYLVKDDVWVTLRLVMSDLGERGESYFISLLESVRFSDTSAPSSSFDYYHKGRLLFLRKDYRGAVASLATALGMERRERRLDAASWRTLAGNLIDSYGATGDLARAKEVMDYATQSDPTNPVFQMALARYYAKLGDLDKVIAHLEKATPVPWGDGRLPGPYDPERDPAFAQFRRDERFRSAAKALRKRTREAMKK